MEEVLVNLAFIEQILTIGTNLSLEWRSQLKNLLKNNQDVFAWKASDMTSIQMHIIELALNANVSVQPVSQKWRVLAPEQSQVVMKEVSELHKGGLSGGFHH